jgi:hypothetical protein
MKVMHRTVAATDIELAVLANGVADITPCLADRVFDIGALGQKRHDRCPERSARVLGVLRLYVVGLHRDKCLSIERHHFALRNRRVDNAYRYRKLSLLRSDTFVTPINFMSRSISARILASAFSTPGCPAAASA